MSMSLFFLGVFASFASTAYKVIVTSSPLGASLGAVRELKLIPYKNVLKIINNSVVAGLTL